jgi:AraC family transcriptional regulator
MERLLRRAITTIRERYDEPLSLDDLARSAMMSKFYFLRTFRCFTGITPLRFLSAVRIHEAKRLLFATHLNVAEVSVQVGYGSLGTFTRRFTECVGLPPTLYRQVARGEATHPATHKASSTMHEIPSATHETSRPSRYQVSMMSGTISATPNLTSPIFIGVFENLIPQGKPIAHTEITRPGAWQLPAVPSGSWHLLAAATADDDAPDGTGVRGPTGRPLLVAISEKIRMQSGEHIQLDMALRPLDWSRPPLLVALPGVEGTAALTSTAVTSTVVTPLR